jgi:hypothetical protein
MSGTASNYQCLLLLPLLLPVSTIALVAMEVDSSTVIVGGGTAANLPHVARNFRRSSEVEIGFGVSVAMQLKTR